MVLRNPGRRVRERFDSVNRTSFFAVLAGLILIAVIVLPRIYPEAQHGMDCTNLAPPLGGNNRSALSFESDRQQGLGLTVALAQNAVSASQPMELTVTFINEDPGPVILYLPRVDPLLTRDANTIGLNLEITRVGDGALINDPSGQRLPQIRAFDREVLHLLGSRARCSVTLTISAQRLAELGLAAGSEYRIRAIYRNGDPGTEATAVPNATATPTVPNALFPPAPIQGVWTGEVTSNEERFAVTG